MRLTWFFIFYLQENTDKNGYKITVYKRITESTEDLIHECGDIVIVEVGASSHLRIVDTIIVARYCLNCSVLYDESILKFFKCVYNL